MNHIKSALDAGDRCDRIIFKHRSGELLVPYAIRNRSTGRVAWVAARPGSGANLRSAAVEVTDFEGLVGLIRQGYLVRCRTMMGVREGLYSPHGHNVDGVYMDGRPLSDWSEPTGLHEGTSS